MSNLSALRGKYNEFLRRCKAIHLKNARKLFFQTKRSITRKNRRIGEI